jgi:hypothetical protein
VRVAVHQQRHTGFVRRSGATVGMSSTSSPGLPTVSPKNNLVLGRTAARQPSMSPGLTNVVSMPKRLQRVVQQVVRAASTARCWPRCATRTHECGDRQVQRRLPAGGGNGANATFKRRHALLEHRIGGVADAAVHMACTLQVEQGMQLGRSTRKRTRWSGESAPHVRQCWGRGRHLHARPRCQNSGRCNQA